MLDEMDKQIDAVVVSTPDHTHFHPSVMALNMGKHLYCEKPLAHSVWEVRHLTDWPARRSWRRSWALSGTRWTTCTGWSNW
jgi:predicted dehydrogenase